MNLPKSLLKPDLKQYKYIYISLVIFNSKSKYQRYLILFSLEYKVRKIKYFKKSCFNI